MSVYRRDFDEPKYLSFFIKDDELLEKYNEIWENVKNNIEEEFDSQPVYNKKYVKAKIKSYNGKINTDLHNNKIPKGGSQFLNSIFRTDKNYHPQVFLEECKYVVKGKQMFEYVTNDIEISSDDSDREDSMMKILIKKILMKKVLIKKIKYRMCFDVSVKKRLLYLNDS